MNCLYVPLTSFSKHVYHSSQGGVCMEEINIKAFKYHLIFGVVENIRRAEWHKLISPCITPNFKKSGCVKLATCLLACIVPRMAEKELEAFLRFGNQRTSLLLMYLTSLISFKPPSDCDFFFIGSVSSCFLSCKLFAHGELERIGQAETDESFFFKKN